jgi:Rieske Fe-S protein
MRDITRRAALGVGGAGATALVLAACTPGGSSSDGSPGGQDAGGGTGESADTSSAPTLATGAVVAKLSDVPVGGTFIATVDGSPIALAQPTAGSVVAYSAICTHQQCVIMAASAEFDCPCHGSIFEAATGEPRAGSKALKPLPPVAVSVRDGEIVAGS